MPHSRPASLNSAYPLDALGVTPGHLSLVAIAMRLSLDLSVSSSSSVIKQGGKIDVNEL